MRPSSARRSRRRRPHPPLVAIAGGPAPPVMGEPSPTGRFGSFGGRFVPELLVPACRDLEAAFREAWADEGFRAGLDGLLRDVVGRPTPLTECDRLSAETGVRILLKREDLAHTGSHKINSALGQALLAERMGKGRLVSESGAGQHGVATATAAALLGLECVVHMGQLDMDRERLDVYRMQLLGAEVVPAGPPHGTLRDAVSEAMRDWVTTIDTSHYCVGSVLGPHPYPWMVRELQRVVGAEARGQTDALLAGADPDVVVACVGGGANAAGIFSGYVDSPAELVGVGPVGVAVQRRRPGVVYGTASYVLQDRVGQVLGNRPLCAGLDTPGIGPEHAHLSHIGRVTYHSVDDGEVLDAFGALARTEGILPALESAHALAWVLRERTRLAGRTVLVNLSGRGDKDVAQVMELTSRSG